jgi:hypothetical protein
MDYMTRSTVSGYQVNKCLRFLFLIGCSNKDELQILFLWKSRTLILQARKTGDSKIFQLIPHSILSPDFPHYFVFEYMHWLDLSTGELEFRPVGSPWMSRPSNWRLYIQRPGILKRLKTLGKYPRAILQKPSQKNAPTQVIDIRSSTFRVVSDLLSPLVVESPTYIVVTHAAQTLEVSLPRLQLSFFVNTCWELECRNMPGYVVDKTQSCGTMFGLRNKLILCPSHMNSNDVQLPRRVIVPQGEISYATNGDFTRVSIHPVGWKHIHWHEYTIDTDLGRLTSNSSLSSTLYQCYLHALTSHCLPDPLLGHTGTEEALYILQSATCTSFQRLGIDEAKLLRSISNLSPERCYSSESNSFKRGPMATLKWNNDLSTLSQHHDFSRIVRSILDHARALETLYDPPTVFDSSNASKPERESDQTLLIRAAFRNKSYYPSALYIPEELSSPGDVKYTSRDMSVHGTAEHAAFRTSWSLNNGLPSFDETISDRDLWDVLNSWGSLGPARRRISLRYSQYWLKFNAARDWLAIYELCRKPKNRNRRDLSIQLSFSLSAAAYSQSKYSDIIPSIIAFALDERFRNLSPPPNVSYVLSAGLAPDVAHVRNLVSRSALPMSLTSRQYTMAEGTAAQKTELLREEEREYFANIRREASVVAESIVQQWPDYRSVDLHKHLFKKYECRRGIKNYIQSISRNIRLRDHILQLQGILQHYEKVVMPASELTEPPPNLFTSSSNTPSYLLRDLLVSRTNIQLGTPFLDGEPFRGGAILPAMTTRPTEQVPQQAGSNILKVLIEEFLHSQQPLLQVYGDELNNSHREMSGQNASQSTRGVVPSHEDLLLYHKECFQKKEKLFLEIEAALAPSQNVEETSYVAGIWPRITPRSLLRQLARDRVNTLPDQWKVAIVRYAVSFLKYQQSLRLLDLSSSKRYEELLREAETICTDVLAESTPDWLLVQVGPLPCGRTSRDIDKMTMNRSKRISWLGQFK